MGFNAQDFFNELNAIIKLDDISETEKYDSLKYIIEENEEYAAQCGVIEEPKRGE